MAHRRALRATLSAGFFGFFAHCGVLSALEEAGLVPARLSGASAGALVAGAWAAGLETGRLPRSCGPAARGLLGSRSRRGLLRGRLFRQRLEELLPVRRLERAAGRSPSRCSISWRAARGSLRGRSPLRFTPPAPCRSCFSRSGSKAGPASTGESPIAPAWPACRLDASSIITWPRARPGGCPAAPHCGCHAARAADLILDGLPRVGPFRLQRGPLA